MQVTHHILGDLNTFLSMLQGVLVSVELGKEGANLHVDLALILEFLQLFRRVALELRQQVLRIDLR